MTDTMYKKKYTCLVASADLLHPRRQWLWPRPVRSTVCHSHQGVGHGLPSSTVMDPATGISLSPGSHPRSLRHRIRTCQKFKFCGRKETRPSSRKASSYCLKPDTSNSHEFELHRPSNKGTKLLLKVIKAIIIIIQRERVVAEDVTRRLQREQAPSSVKQFQAELVRPDAWNSCISCARAISLLYTEALE